MDAATFWLNLIVMFALAMIGLFLFADLRKWKKIAADLQKDHRHMYQTINFLPDPTFVIDRKGRVVAWSRAMEELTGIQSEDILGKGNFEYAMAFYGERRPVMIDLVGSWDDETAAKYQSLRKIGNILSSESKESHRPFGDRYFKNTAGPLYDEKGTVIGAIETIHDITARRKTEKALAESEALMRLFVENTPAAVAMCDTRMNYLAYSRRWVSDYNLPDEDLRGRCHYDVFEVIPDHWKEQHRRCFAGETIENDEEPFTRADGTTDWVKRTLHPWRTKTGQIGGLILFTEVITAKKLAEENLHLMERILENSPAILFRWKAAEDGWPVSYVSENVSQFGYSADEFLSAGKPYASIIHPDDLEDVKRRAASPLRRDEVPFQQEYRIVTKNGKCLWIDDRAIIRRDENGSIVHAQGVVLDITDRKKAQEEVHKRRLFLESVLYHAPDAVIILDAHHRVTDWNPGAEKIFGYTRQEAFGRELDRLVTRDDALKEAGQKTQAVLSGNRVEAFETVRYRKDGTPVYVIAAGSPIMVDGTLTAVVAMYTDISALKRAEEEVKRSERMLRRIMDIVPSMIFVRNAKGRFLMANKAVADSYGTTVDAIVGQYHQEIHPDPEQVTQFLKDDQKALESGRPLFIPEEPYQDGSGATRWLEVVKMPCDETDFGEPAIVGLATDITLRREAEARLQESEKRYRSVFENTGTGTVLSEADTTLSMVNKEFATMVGYSRAEIEGKMSWTRFIVPADVERMVGYHKARREDPAGAPTQWECGLIDREGNVKRMLLKVRLIPGTATSIGAFLDITELKRSEEEIVKLRNYLSNIIDSMPSVLIGVDTEGRVTQWNRQAEKVSGVAFEKAQQQPLKAVFPQLANEMDRITTAIKKRKVLKEPKIPRHIRGESRFEDVTIFPLVANGVEGAVIRVDDVTEQVRLEEMMIQSEKMLSVGGLAAGMAHEINNPLAGILQNAAVIDNRLFSDLPANHKAAETAGTTMAAIIHYLELRKLPNMLDNIHRSGSRAADIVKNMLSFARKSDRMVSSHDLASLLDQTIALVRTDYDMKKKYDFKQIEIVRHYEENIGPVPCEASKIQQVFLNILKNGAEAMGKATRGAAPPKFALNLKSDGPWARIEIEDNGPGMDAQTRRRIFEPFFTTKPVGEGTGLGLSVSYFIITENHGGTMDVSTGAKGGTRFVVRLPKAGKS